MSQPAYDVLRIDDNGIGRAYRVWEEWVPQVVTTPDGGAWVFFTAQIRTPEGNAVRRLFASRFDPGLRVWLPARGIGPTPRSSAQPPRPIARESSTSFIRTGRVKAPRLGVNSSINGW